MDPRPNQGSRLCKRLLGPGSSFEPEYKTQKEISKGLGLFTQVQRNLRPGQRPVERRKVNESSLGEGKEAEAGQGQVYWALQDFFSLMTTAIQPHPFPFP